ncbi:hypothetical protein, partial [Treponema sp.]|uniref:hypothetical protein n=1 Tax=Treponema sp. TaxID=166 RepID=UPI00389092BC
KPVISHETNENFISLSSSELKKLNDGEYFWSVTQTDSEGNESAKAVTRRFYAINGEIEQRTVFPPDNYEVWLPLLSDTRFTWKTNLSFMQYLQIAADRDFNQIIFDSETNGTSFSGAGLDIGEYYWRITTKEENFKRATPAKKLCVVGELDFPKIEYPANSRKAVVRPTEPCTFAWKEEEGADYYRVKLYRQDGETPLYDENFINGTSVDIDVEKFPEGNYRWEIQSYAYETALSSRRSSLLSRANFTLRKIRPVTLISPQNGKVYGGWEAIENPTELQWASSENCSSAQLILTKKNGIEPGEKIFDQNSYKQVFQQLSSGDYEWTVKAFTEDELDISATQSFTFKVEEIPPFAAPKNARTEGGSLFNADYLKKTPYIVFYWEKVNRADSYILEIFKKGKVIHRQVISDVNITKFKFEDLQKLLKGDFAWKLRAVRMTDDKKEVLIDGNPAEGMFTIDYTLNANGGKRKNTGALYGQ